MAHPIWALPPQRLGAPAASSGSGTVRLGAQTPGMENVLTLQRFPIKQPVNSPQVIGGGWMSTEDRSSQKIKNLMQVRESWEKEKVIVPLSHKKESFKTVLEVRAGSF